MRNAVHVRVAFQEVLTSDAFAQKLEEVWMEFGHLGPVERIQKVWRSQNEKAATVLPSIEIDLTISRNTDNRNATLLKHLQHEVHLYVHARGDDEELLDDKIGVYVAALREFFMENPRLEGLDNPDVLFGDDQFSPFVPENIYEGRPLLKSGLLVILVETLDHGRS